MFFSLVLTASAVTLTYSEIMIITNKEMPSFGSLTYNYNASLLNNELVTLENFHAVPFLELQNSTFSLGADGEMKRNGFDLKSFYKFFKVRFIA